MNAGIAVDPRGRSRRGGKGRMREDAETGRREYAETRRQGTFFFRSSEFTERSVYWPRGGVRSAGFLDGRRGSRPTNRGQRSPPAPAELTSGRDRSPDDLGKTLIKEKSP
jgi:hypothetical protein